MTFLNSLGSWWLWALLLAIPPAIIALYFLKLKRQPLEVPSTYLWSRTIEDLHVNSIWQRLRQSLLLFLQLLLIVLVMAALLRPGWRGTRLSGNHFVFLIDHSASMSATDVAPNRLEKAKEQVRALLKSMKSGDEAMIIAFSDSARTVQGYTANQRELERAIDKILPTNRTSDLEEALRVASGLANPGVTRLEGRDLVDDSVPATLYVFSDGGFPAIPTFDIGNLDPIYVPIGDPAVANIGILAFNAERNEARPDQVQAFARVHNFGDQDQEISLSLFADDLPRPIDSQAATIKAGSSLACEFDVQNYNQSKLTLRVDDPDPLLLDNTAYTSINAPQPARVLLVTSGNDPLQLVLTTEAAEKLAYVTTAEPDVLQDKTYQQQAATGAYDLVIFDQCQPQVMPTCNTVFLDALPPGDRWKAGARGGPPLIIDVDQAHPLMQLVNLDDVLIYQSVPLETPEGGNTLIESVIGNIMSIAPRDGYEDLVLGFGFWSRDEEGNRFPNTDWPIRRSFPVFFMNLLTYLGGNQGDGAAPSIRPGEAIVLRSALPVDEIRIARPVSGRQDTVTARSGNTFVYADTSTPGIYDVREGSGDQVTSRFAVNLFDARESDLKPAAAIDLAHKKIAGSPGLEPTRRELWKWILLGGLAILLFEWYVYNRRVYL